MANTAAYIYKKLKEDHLLTKAFNWDQERGTQDFDIVCVGHSLGAGTATILAIMLKQEFPSTKCFAYSPPGGLLRLVDLDIYGHWPFAHKTTLHTVQATRASGTSAKANLPQEFSSLSEWRKKFVAFISLQALESLDLRWLHNLITQ